MVLDKKIMQNIKGRLIMLKKIIINHNIQDAIGNSFEENLGFLGKYQGRALCISRENDLIQLNPKLKKEIGWILEHYQRVGIKCSRNIIWDDSFQILSKYSDFDFSVFFFSENVHRFRADFRWLKAVKMLNSKNQFIKLCERLSIPVPRTICFKNKRELRLNNLDLNFPVFVKIAESASGFGTIECQNTSEVEKCLDILDENIEFQIQEKVSGVKKFINLQYVVNGQCQRLAATEQILNGFQHAGNKYPIKYEPWFVVDSLAKYINYLGMKGVFAFDLAITENKQVFAIECNPRFNGSSYPSLVAKRLNIHKWLTKNFSTRINSLADLTPLIKDLEYNFKKKEGIIIINWGIISEGKVSIMLIGDNISLLEKKLIERL